MSKGRTAIFGEIAVMIFALIALDFMPKLALYFLVAGIAAVTISSVLLKRQIERLMSRIPGIPRASRVSRASQVSRASRTPPGFPSANDGLAVVNPIDAAQETPDVEKLIVEATQIEKLAVETLNIEELAAEAAVSEKRLEKPYVAPSYDLFD